MLPVGGADSLNLFDMVFKVMCVVQHKVAQSPGEVRFCVRAGPQERFLRHFLEEFVILRTKTAKGFQRLRNLASSVIQAQLPAPNVLRRNGFDRNIYETLMISGEEVTVTAYAVKDGSKHAWAGGLTRADGQTIIPLGEIPGQGRGRGGARGPQPQ